MEAWLTVGDVVARLKVHERTVRRWIDDGRLPAKRLGGRAGYRIAESDLRAFMETDAPAPKGDDEKEGTR